MQLTGKTPKKGTQNIKKWIGNLLFSGVNAKKPFPVSERVLIQIGIFCLLIMAAICLLILHLVYSTNCGTPLKVSPPEAHSGLFWPGITFLVFHARCSMIAIEAEYTGGCDAKKTRLKQYDPKDFKPFKLKDQFYSLN